MGRPPSDIRDRLLHAARGRFLRDGVDGASLRGIAKDAGSNIGMLYYYFETKDELFFEVLEEVYATLLSDMESLLANDEPIGDRLEAVSIRIGRMSQDELEVIRIVLREVLTSSERRGRLFKRFEAGHIALAARAISAAASSGQLQEGPLPVLMAAAFTTMIVPQALRRVVSGADGPLPLRLLPDVEELAREMRNVLERGVLRSSR